jgi:colanic acid/amylovoran biosynthesis glycosyltransferase
MNTRIGYLVPEFPGQTHIFFWREIEALKTMGIEPEMISTRHPPANIVSHTWASSAQQQTTYLFPGTQLLQGAVLELMRSGPMGWLRCLGAIAQAQDVSLKGRLRLLGLMLPGAEVAHLARSRQWTHLHIHSCADAANVALFAHLLSGIPYSLSLHGPLTDYGPNQPQKWQHAKFAIAITKKLFHEIEAALTDHLPHAVFIAPMGVDCTTLQRSQPYVPWRSGTPFRLFSCGRLNRCKGHADLIRAVGLLRQQDMEVELAIAGEDEQGGTGYRKELETLIQELNLQGSVHLLGAVSEAVVKQHLEASHAFCLASLHEPLGVAIMEAMAMETPVIVTGSGGVKELVDDGVDGLLVEPESPEQIVSAVMRLMQNTEFTVQLGKTAREKIVRSFHHKRSAEILMVGMGILD